MLKKPQNFQLLSLCELSPSKSQPSPERWFRALFPNRFALWLLCLLTSVPGIPASAHCLSLGSVRSWRLLYWYGRITMVCRLFHLLCVSLNHSFHGGAGEREHLTRCQPVGTHPWLLPLQGPQSRQKAWKVTAQPAPASRSWVPPAASTWRTSILTRDAAPSSIPSDSNQDQLIALRLLRTDAVSAIISDWFFFLVVPQFWKHFFHCRVVLHRLSAKVVL